MAEITKEFEIRDGVLIRFCGKGSTAHIPEEVTVIGSAAFAHRTKLKKVVLPTGLLRIEAGAFESCTALCEIVVPNTVTEIAGAAFMLCTSLKTAVLPEALSEICDNTFSGCQSLKDIELPPSVISIGTNAFMDCSTLARLTVPESMCEIGHYAFAGCSALCEVYLPSGLIRFGRGLFSGCASLTVSSLPPGAAEIPDETFKGCEKLKKVRIGDRIRRVGEHAFDGCALLEELDLPQTVEQLCDFCFAGTALTEIRLGDKISFIGQYAIPSTVPCVIIPNPCCSVHMRAFTDVTVFSMPVHPLRISEHCRIYAIIGCAVAAANGIKYPTDIAEAYREICKSGLAKYNTIKADAEQFDRRYASSLEYVLSERTSKVSRFLPEIIRYLISEHLLSGIGADRLMNLCSDNAELQARLIEYKVKIREEGEEDLKI